MRIEERVPAEVKKQLNYKSNHKRKKNNHKRNDYSEHEIKRLMGQYRPTYTRVRGAFRQR